MIKYEKPDFNNHELLSDDRLNLHFKNLTDEDLEEINKGKGWISIKFQFMEDRRKQLNDGRGGTILKTFEGFGFGYADCSFNTVKYLFSLYKNQAIKHQDYFH